MLKAYLGDQERRTMANTTAGRIISDHGGIATTGIGMFVLDGLIYDIEVHRRALALADADDVHILATLIGVHGLAKALSIVNGDFALVWAEKSSRTLWLARDPVGMRPLYYSNLNHGSWAVSSQPRGLLQLAGVSPDPDQAFMLRYAGLHYRMIDSEPDRSPYADISQVPAGTIVGLQADGSMSSEGYWVNSESPDFTSDEGVLAEEYRDLLLDSVRIRLARHENRAFTLSGGMDSSSVLAAAVHLEGAPQSAFSTLYRDSTYDESGEIKDMLDGYVSDWYPILIPDEIDIVSEVDRLIRIHDEPVATATWLSHMLLCDSVSEKGFTSIFGGLGGDELNAGEYEYFPFHFADLCYDERHEDLKREIGDWVAHHDHPIFRKTPQIALDSIRRLTDPDRPGACLPDTQRLSRYLRVLKPEFQIQVNLNPTMETVYSSYLKNRTWQDLTRETIPCCIRAEDRHGAALGVPPVLPFLDKRLISFMYRVPGSMKIREGVTKRLLREAMRGILPEVTRSRVKKTGWNAPAHLWFSGPGGDMLRDLVKSVEFDDLGIYDRDAVLEVIDDHDRIVQSNLLEENHMMFLWQLLNLLRWHALNHSDVPHFS